MSPRLFYSLLYSTCARLIIFVNTSESSRLPLYLFLSLFSSLTSSLLPIRIAFERKTSTYYSKTTTIHSLYVKREVRSLTEEDRENFLDALYTMWSIGTMKGRDL
jgi:hypothetical protein